MSFHICFLYIHRDPVVYDYVFAEDVVLPNDYPLGWVIEYAVCDEAPGPLLDFHLKFVLLSVWRHVWAVRGLAIE